MNLEIWNEVDKRIQNPNEACPGCGYDNNLSKTGIFLVV